MAKKYWLAQTQKARMLNIYQEASRRLSQLPKWITGLWHLVLIKMKMIKLGCELICLLTIHRRWIRFKMAKSLLALQLQLMRKVVLAGLISLFQEVVNGNIEKGRHVTSTTNWCLKKFQSLTPKMNVIFATKRSTIATSHANAFATITAASIATTTMQSSSSIQNNFCNTNGVKICSLKMSWMMQNWLNLCLKTYLTLSSLTPGPTHCCPTITK